MDSRLSSVWWTLKIALGLAPIVAGLDKFFNVLTNWSDYLNPQVLQIVPVDADTFMRCVGVVEIVVGLAILTFATRMGSYLAVLWFVAIAGSLIAMHRFYDIAVRDLLLAVSALTLARLSAIRHAAPHPSDAAPRKIARGELLGLHI
jgi:uncharacterized membrane protein YphA (DoxX/SURF4 family)